MSLYNTIYFSNLDIELDTVEGNVYKYHKNKKRPSFNLVQKI